MSEILVDDFLAHYGVRGMKWGKRKAKSDSLKEDEEETPKKTYPRLTKKQAIIGASILVGVAVAAVVIANRGDIAATLKGVPRAYETTAKERVDRILRRNADRKDIVLPQGQVFSRISHVAETSVRDATYVSYKQKDILEYKTKLGSGGKHQVKIEALSDIKLPSRKNKISTLSEMVDSPLSSPAYNGKTLREVMVNQERAPKTREYLNSVSSRKLAALVNDRMDIDDFRVGYGKEFLNKLKDKGYSAISDPIDSTSNGQNRKSASILIDSALFKVVESKSLTSEELSKAKSELTKLLQ